MKNQVKELMKMKEGIEQAKTEKAQAEGKLESYLEQLLKEFKCKNETEAETLLDKLEKELESLQSEFDKGMEKLNAG